MKTRWDQTVVGMTLIVIVIVWSTVLYNLFFQIHVSLVRFLHTLVSGDIISLPFFAC